MYFLILIFKRVKGGCENNPLIFYSGGAIGWGGGSSSGTTNYNDMTNTPIKNISGTDAVPINLANLNIGHYNLVGAYKYATNSNTYIADSIDVKVTTDEVTKQKVVYYNIIKDN